jgi:hypothetical protein
MNIRIYNPPMIILMKALQMLIFKAFGLQIQKNYVILKKLPLCMRYFKMKK